MSADTQASGRRPHGTRDASLLEVLLTVAGLPVLLFGLVAFGDNTRHVELGVAVCGRVVRSDGVARSRIDDRSGCFVRIEVDSYVTTRGSGGSWREVHADTWAVPFWIGDGSGVELYVDQSLIVDVERCACTTHHDSHRGIDGFSSPVRQYMRANKKLARSLEGNDRVRVNETVAGDGESVTLVGRLASKREGPYRDGDGGVLVPEVVECVFLGELAGLRAYLMRPARRRRLLTALCIVGAVTFLAGVVLTARHRARHARRAGVDVTVLEGPRCGG